MKQIIDVEENLHKNIRHAETINEYKQIIIEKWVFKNFENVKLEHKLGYSIMTDCEGQQMKITYKKGKLELKF